MLLDEFKKSAKEIADEFENLWEYSDDHERAAHAKILSDLDGAKLLVAIEKAMEVGW